MQVAQVVVGAGLHLGLEAVDDRRDRLQHLELLAFAGVQQLVEQAHTAVNATGAGDRSAAAAAVLSPGCPRRLTVRRPPHPRPSRRWPAGRSGSRSWPSPRSRCCSRPRPTRSRAIRPSTSRRGSAWCSRWSRVRSCSSPHSRRRPRAGSSPRSSGSTCSRRRRSCSRARRSRRSASRSTRASAPRRSRSTRTRSRSSTSRTRACRRTTRPCSSGCSAASPRGPTRARTKP